jgi:hypothetical protein
MSVPNYSYADEMLSPRELGIKRDGSFDSIMRAVGGINYYADVIGFGESTVYAKSQNMQQSPLGIRYFLDTGATCSNGANMHEYVNTVPTGLGGRVGKEMKAMGLPELRGLGPGIVEDAASALNPVPLMNAMVRGGYARCKQVTLPVGNADGRLASVIPNASKEPWIQGPTKMVGGKPHQTRWVFDDWISASDYDATPKTAGSSASEGFVVSLKTSQVAAVVLLGTLVAAMYMTR